MSHMIKNVQTIEINLDGLETIIVPKEHIGHFEVNNITRNLHRQTLTKISEKLVAEEVFLQLSSEANTMDNYIQDNAEEKPFERIVLHNDIKYLTINYDDESKDYIHLNWKELQQDANDKLIELIKLPNEYQTSTINEHTGDLYIVISPSKTVENYFGSLLEDKRKPRLWKELKTLKES